MKPSVMPAADQIPVSRSRIILCLAFSALVLLVGRIANAAEPQLEISVGKQARQLSRHELLAHPALRTIDIPADSAYKRPMRYRALPLHALIEQLAQVDTLQFAATDGFVANIPGKALVGAAQPWIAIEPPDAAWPPVKPGGASAGAFYLVWLSPEKSGITPEQWPYQIAKISEVLPLEARYPQIQPLAAFVADGAERRGMHVYATNCAVCHQLNGGGDASIGPDLNQPFGPTEYFQEPFLRKLIRNSASVRNWGQRAMPEFPPTVINDENLNDLLAYLRQMAKQRQ